MSSTNQMWPPVMTLGCFKDLMEFKSRDAARKFIKRHRVPHCAVGNRVFIRTSSLLEFLKQREATVEPAATSTGARMPPSVRRPGVAVNRTTRGDALTSAGRRHDRRSKHAANVAEGT